MATYNCNNCAYFSKSFRYCNKYNKKISIDSAFRPISEPGDTIYIYIRCNECIQQDMIKNKKENNTMNTKRNMDIILNPNEIKTIIKQHLESEGFSINDINNITFEISNEPIAFNDNTTKPTLTSCKVRASK